MRLLHVHGAAQLAGCERTCETFLRSTPWAQHVVAVLGSGGPAVHAWDSAGAQVEILEAPTSRSAQFRKLEETVTRHRPDGVILWTNSRLGLLVAACQPPNGKVVVHVGNPVRMSPTNKVAATAYMKLPNARAATLIPVSHHVAETCGHMPAFREYPMCVVYNAIAINQFRFQPVEIPSTGVRVGMVARLDTIKDHATLLRAWKLLCQQNLNWTLELAGDGNLRPNLEKLAAELGIEKQVVFHGWVKNIASLMMNWTMVVHSTTEEEGLGNSMLEAMALGRPLVATDVGPVREVTDDGRVARLSRPGDVEDLAAQIVDTVREQQETRHRAEEARAWVESRFSQRAMVCGYMRSLGLTIPS